MAQRLFSLTGVTRWTFKPEVSSNESLMRLRQRGTFCFLFTKDRRSNQPFDCSNAVFRPAGGERHPLTENCITPVIWLSMAKRKPLHSQRLRRILD